MRAPETLISARAGPATRIAHAPPLMIDAKVAIPRTERILIGPPHPRWRVRLSAVRVDGRPGSPQRQPDCAPCQDSSRPCSWLLRRPGWRRPEPFAAAHRTATGPLTRPGCQTLAGEQGRTAHG